MLAQVQKVVFNTNARAKSCFQRQKSAESGFAIQAHV